MEKIVNYTPEQVTQMVEMYQSGESTAVIANTFGKTVRSVVAKLSREGVYVPKSKATSDSRVTKANLIDGIAAKLGVPAETFESLEKATKEALEVLASKL